MNYYGIRTEEEIKQLVHKICVLFGNNNEDLIKRSEALLNETLCAESRYGNEPDNTEETGVGISQFDLIGFYDMKANSMKYKKLIWDNLKFDLELLTLEHSRYDEVTSIMYMRLKYKRRPERIPDTREERAKYWKQWYNSSMGAGTEEHYIENSNIILGAINA